MKNQISKLQNEMNEWCEAVESRPNYYICYEKTINMKELEESEFWWLKDAATVVDYSFSKKNTECWSNDWKDFEWQCQNIIAHETLEPLA